MTRSAHVAVIGGGVNGCSIAYNLAKQGCTDVVVFEKSYLCSGSTGRCGAGVRCQWGTEMNCRLAFESIKMFETLNEELGYDYDIEFKQKGYLILAYTEKEWEQFKLNVRLQNSLGIPSRLVTPEEARGIVPGLCTEGMLGATYCKKDGHCNPHHTTWAYARAAERLGVRVKTGVEVKDIMVRNGRVRKVVTSEGAYNVEVVVNAAGPWAKPIGAMVGLDIPVYTERHQILVTEPCAPVQDPMVISFSKHFYCQQTPHGSFVMGYGDPTEVKGYDIGHSWQFLERMVQVVTPVLPVLKELRLVRQWSGLYTISPDCQPILGGTPKVEGFFMAVGFSGHGFMLAPVVGRLVAEQIMGRPTSLDISMLDLERFDRGELILEPSVV
ncbi:MAG: FAD-binding oxidoreductase [Firmicutes bacterium]|nr:FAD-binding oxidoreductase [Bacillota bacterium]